VPSFDRVVKFVTIVKKETISCLSYNNNVTATTVVAIDLLSKSYHRDAEILLQFSEELHK